MGEEAAKHPSSFEEMKERQAPSEPLGVIVHWEGDHGDR